MWLYSLSWLLLTLYSFTLQDLNLTWYPWLPSWLTSAGFYQRPGATLLFVILGLLLIVSYLRLIRKSTIPRWSIFLLLAVSGILAYPMFSYDIFNYLFNAKMVLVYHANPHLKTAIEFAFDPMLRFMQNSHTPAPYAYGWTVVSLLPGLAWFSGKFTLSFWAMKGFMVLGWLGQLWILQKLVKKLFPKESWRLWLFALNPLVLTETLINGHNDVVMMLPALLAYWFYLKSDRVKAIVWLLVSASIKYATIVLLPLIALQGRTLKKIDIPSLSAIALLLAMFTRPDQLHSWYLIWGFSFAVLAKPKWLVSLFTALTLGALLRYAPYIYYGHWDPPVYLIRNLIWIASLGLTPLIRKSMLK